MASAVPYLGERARYAAEFLEHFLVGTTANATSDGEWLLTTARSTKLVDDAGLIERAEYWIGESADWTSLDHWIEARRQRLIEVKA